MNVTLERARDKIVQFALCLLVGTMSGGILLLNLDLKWEVAVLGVLGIIVLILVTKSPGQILLCMLAFLVPFYLGKAVFDWPESTSYNTNVSIYLSDILALILLLIFLGELARRKVKFSSFSQIMVPALVWLIFSSFSVAAAKDGELFLFQMFNMGKMVLLCWVIASSVRNDSELTIVISGLMLGMVFQSLVGIYQGITGNPLNLSFLAGTVTVNEQMLSGGLVSRVSGTLMTPNTFAMYLSTGVPFALALLFSRTKLFVKILAGIILCLMGWALIFSLSRAAWGIFILTICIVLVLAIRRKRISSMAAIVIAGAAAVVLSGVALLYSDRIQARLTSYDQGSVATRFTLAEAALAIIRDNPVVGIGLNNYTLVSPRYDPADAAAWNEFTPIVHNVFLLIAAETGLLGLGTFMVFLVVLINPGLADHRPGKGRNGVGSWCRHSGRPDRPGNTRDGGIYPAWKQPGVYSVLVVNRAYCSLNETY